MIHMDVGNQFICSPNAKLLVLIEKSRNRSGIARRMTALWQPALKFLVLTAKIKNV